MDSDTQNGFVILEGYERTSEYLDRVCGAADEYRDALGFFGRSVYEEFARKGLLYVLVKESPTLSEYVGHLLFSCRYPRANVVQIFIAPKYRRGGRAGFLLNQFKRWLTQQGFISVYARVAEDLLDANAFWNGHQFYVQRVEQGGVSRNRRILVRCHELPSPQLFPASGISNTNPLGLSMPASNDIPLFLLDLNVLFDVMPRRLRHEEAASLFQAERMNSCRLAISDEIASELKRTADAGRTDPMTAYIGVFPSFPIVDGAESESLIQELAEIVFPQRSLSSSDRSDLRHLVTAIVHDLAGFITSDSKILATSTLLQERYGLQVVSPAVFRMDGASLVAGSAFDVSSDSTLRLSTISVDEEQKVRTFLSKMGLSGSAIAAVWCPPEPQGQGISRIAVWKDSDVLGYSSWTTRLPKLETVFARVAIGEDNLQASAAGRILLTHLVEQIASSGLRHVSLEIPTHQGLLRELALGLGFRGSSNQTPLTKLVLGKVFTRVNWEIYRQELADKGGPKLPSSIPAYRNVDQQLAVLTSDGNQAHVSLDLLESLLSPALFCLPGRPAVITPIQRRFSEALLGHSKQTPLLPLGNASTYQDRHYLGSPRTLRYFKRGTLILFYESTKRGGRGELVALSRVRQAYQRLACDLATNLQQSVLTESHLNEIGQSETKTVVVFDNIFHLPRCVPLSSLQRIGCGRPNDLISTRPIKDEQLQEILLEAFQS